LIGISHGVEVRDGVHRLRWVLRDDEEDLGHDDNFIPGEVVFLDRPTEYFLGNAVGIGVSSVEGVNPRIITLNLKFRTMVVEQKIRHSRRFDMLRRLLFSEDPIPGPVRVPVGHAPEDDSRHFQT